MLSSFWHWYVIIITVATIIGSFWLLRWTKGVSQRDAVGGNDLDRPRQVVDRHPVEEPAVVGEAHVGQQVPVPGRLVGSTFDPEAVAADRRLNFIDEAENRAFGRRRGYTETICVRRPS